MAWAHSRKYGLLSHEDMYKKFHRFSFYTPLLFTCKETLKKKNLLSEIFTDMLEPRVYPCFDLFITTYF